MSDPHPEALAAADAGVTLLDPSRPYGVIAFHGGRTHAAGTYDDGRQIAYDTARLAQHGVEMYVTVNPVAAEFADRHPLNEGRVPRRGDSPGDADIARRTRLLIDIEPDRKSGTGSTDAPARGRQSPRRPSRGAPDRSRVAAVRPRVQRQRVPPVLSHRPARRRRRPRETGSGRLRREVRRGLWREGEDRYERSQRRPFAAGSRGVEPEGRWRPPNPAPHVPSREDRPDGQCCDRGAVAGNRRGSPGPSAPAKAGTEKVHRRVVRPRSVHGGLPARRGRSARVQRRPQVDPARLPLEPGAHEPVRLRDRTNGGDHPSRLSPRRLRRQESGPTCGPCSTAATPPASHWKHG